MSDMETGYKVFKKILRYRCTRAKIFGIEPEITIKLAKKIKFLKSQ